MKAQIKNYYIVDNSLVCEEEDEFTFSLELEIGPEGANIQDVFYAEIYSPLWIERRFPPKGISSKKRIIVSSTRNISEVVTAIAQKISNYCDDDWDCLAMKLNAFLRWEYEGYSQ